MPTNILPWTRYPGWESMADWSYQVTDVDGPSVQKELVTLFCRELKRISSVTVGTPHYNLSQFPELGWASLEKLREALPFYVNRVCTRTGLVGLTEILFAREIYYGFCLVDRRVLYTVCGKPPQPFEYLNLDTAQLPLPTLGHLEREVDEDQATPRLAWGWCHSHQVLSCGSCRAPYHPKTILHKPELLTVWGFTRCPSCGSDSLATAKPPTRTKKDLRNLVKKSPGTQKLQVDEGEHAEDWAEDGSFTPFSRTIEAIQREVTEEILPEVLVPFVPESTVRGNLWTSNSIA